MIQKVVVEKAREGETNLVFDRCVTVFTKNQLISRFLVKTVILPVTDKYFKRLIDTYEKNLT
jgi:hypothetical protein